MIVCHSSWIKGLPEIVIGGHTVKVTTLTKPNQTNSENIFMLYLLMKKPSDITNPRLVKVDSGWLYWIL
jgi:hypothetical protein